MERRVRDDGWIVGGRRRDLRKLTRQRYLLADVSLANEAETMAMPPFDCFDFCPFARVLTVTKTTASRHTFSPPSSTMQFPGEAKHEKPPWYSLTTST